MDGTDPGTVNSIVYSPEFPDDFGDHVLDLCRVGDVDLDHYGAIIRVGGDAFALGCRFLGGRFVYVCEGDAGCPFGRIGPSTC